MVIYTRLFVSFEKKFRHQEYVRDIEDDCNDKTLCLEKGKIRIVDHDLLRWWLVGWST